MVGVFVSFDYDDELDRERVLGVAEKARSAFEGMPGLRLKVFTFDAEGFHLRRGATAGHERLRLGVRRRTIGVLHRRADGARDRPVRRPAPDRVRRGRRPRRQRGGASRRLLSRVHRPCLGSSGTEQLG